MPISERHRMQQDPIKKHIFSWEEIKIRNEPNKLSISIIFCPPNYKKVTKNMIFVADRKNDC